MLFLYLAGLFGIVNSARQFPQPHQRQASESLWDRIDVQELDKQLAAWHQPSVSSGTRRPLAEEQARQSYPDIPRPIPPVEIHPIPPSEHIQSPQGCLAPRGQFPSPRSCAHYLNCWDEIVVEQQCPGGLLFNELTSVCDFEYNVYCAGRPGLPPKPELPPGSKVCPEPNGRYRSSTNCSEFFVCVYGRPVKYGCPRSLVYNEELGVCDYPFRVDCRGATPPQTHPVLPHPTHTPVYPPQQPHYPPQQPQQPHYPPQQPQQPHYPPQQPQQPHYPPQQPQQPHYPPQYPVQPSYPQPGTGNPWLHVETRGETDPWHQRPVASEFELQQEKEKDEKQQQQALLEQGVGILQQDNPEKPLLINPWGQVQAIPANLAKVPCKDGDVHRLTESCSSVVVCRENRPQLVQCPSAHTYDRVSDSCQQFTIAKC